jgi:site-specific DNA recombinase
MLRIDDHIDHDTYACKKTQLMDRLTKIKLQFDRLDRSHDETAELAVKVFGPSQTLRQQWLTADYAANRRIFEIVFLNCRLDAATLVPKIRKPFDVLAEGLVSKNSRGDRRCTFPNDLTGMRLLHTAISQSRPFTAAELAVMSGGQPS